MLLSLSAPGAAGARMDRTAFSDAVDRRRKRRFVPFAWMRTGVGHQRALSTSAASDDRLSDGRRATWPAAPSCPSQSAALRRVRAFADAAATSRLSAAFRRRRGLAPMRRSIRIQVSTASTKSSAASAAPKFPHACIRARVALSTCATGQRPQIAVTTRRDGWRRLTTEDGGFFVYAAKGDWSCRTR